MFVIIGFGFISSEKYADLGGCCPPWPITMQLTWSEILRSYLASLDNLRMCFPNLVNRQWKIWNNWKYFLFFIGFIHQLQKDRSLLIGCILQLHAVESQSKATALGKCLTSGFLFNGVFTYCNLRRILLTCRHFKNGCLI